MSNWYYVINDKDVIQCDANGVPITSGKAKKRKLDKKENEVESDYVESINGFDFKASRAYDWVKEVFNSKTPSYNEVRSLTKTMSILTGILLPREVYRRKCGCFHWLYVNEDEVNKVLNKYAVKAVINDRVFKVTPIRKSFPPVLINKSPSPPVDTEEIDIPLFGDDDTNDFFEYNEKKEESTSSSDNESDKKNANKSDDKYLSDSNFDAFSYHF